MSDLTKRLRAYPPMNLEYVVIKAADRIDALEECLRDTMARLLLNVHKSRDDVQAMVKALDLLADK